ncbi:hypothetical protein [Pedobacter nutrimenti]|uniref:Uncharacterized protein n=1 Tax=Pedobacter nutrimenti TaxID=1241337 RepID=A0A318ULC9_9SPHI|nr:hypothetical protein [Pedobacter nutrimenti]PYF69507.1 hypothetical protein B0O44_110147 [Pedobacter nutrimenti]
MRKITFLISLSLCFTACQNQDEVKRQAAQTYFDLKGYFVQESSRLNKLNPQISKTVMVNGAAESKDLHIKDWNAELTVFSDADINKTAWQGLFKVSKQGQREFYKSDQDKVAVKALEVFRKNNKVSGLRILLHTKNYLYNSVDTLEYYPDSLYRISKTQNIKLLNSKAYRITGKF